MFRLLSNDRGEARGSAKSAWCSLLPSLAQRQDDFSHRVNKQAEQPPGGSSSIEAEVYRSPPKQEQPPWPNAGPATVAFRYARSCNHHRSVEGDPSGGCGAHLFDSMKSYLAYDVSEGAASTTPICGAPEAKQLPRENSLHQSVQRVLRKWAWAERDRAGTYCDLLLTTWHPHPFLSPIHHQGHRLTGRDFHSVTQLAALIVVKL